MKKLKLNLANMQGAEMLTREQLKKVIGGDDGSGDSGCTSDADCNKGEKCGPRLAPGVKRECVEVEYAANCSTDSDCGNGQKCHSYAPPLSGKFCA